MQDDEDPHPRPSGQAGIDATATDILYAPLPKSEREARGFFRIQAQNSNENFSSADSNPVSGSTQNNWFKKMFGRKNGENSLLEALEDYMEDDADTAQTSIARHERLLISNILKLRDMTAVDAMIPRADIIAIDIETTQQDLLGILSEKQYSRFPVYKQSMDNIIGTIHIKDILSALAKGDKVNIRELIRDVPVIAPSMPVLDLLMEMRHSRRHMAIVIDEYGGVDGLVTVGDIIEAIIGEISDEHDQDEEPQMTERADGTVVVDARVLLEELEESYNIRFPEEDSEDIDTIGGYVSSLSGRVPARGEVIKDSDMNLEFEILDADPRRICKLRIRNIKA